MAVTACLDPLSLVLVAGGIVTSRPRGTTTPAPRSSPPTTIPARERIKANDHRYGLVLLFPLALACSASDSPPPATQTSETVKAAAPSDEVSAEAPVPTADTGPRDPLGSEQTAGDRVSAESDRANLRPGRRMGSYQLTYYWLADEKAIGGRPTVKLRDKKCKVIATVSREFRKAILREGSGKLTDGRVLNVGARCKCAKRCFLLVAKESPYGYGIAGRSLRPFRSVSAPRSIKVGTVLYLPELDGLTIPGGSAMGGRVHNGCVVADDRGGGVEGRQLDLFTGRRNVYKLFTGAHRLRRITVHRGGDRCIDFDGEGTKRGEG